MSRSTPPGQPFAIRATQRLDVRRIGDYAFTIGAPSDERRDRAGVERRCPACGQARTSGKASIRAAGSWRRRSRSSPGGRRTAATRRRRRRPGHADRTRPPSRSPHRRPRATRASCATYLAALRAAAARGEPATGGGTTITSTLAAGAAAHLGAARDRRDDRTKAACTLTLGGAGRPETAVFPAGAIHLTVRPLPPLELLDPPPGESGRALFARATRASLESRGRGSTTRSSATPTRPARAARPTST